jgi:hypothetical protein
MMLEIMCALWVNSACDQIDIRNADKAIGACRVEMMKATRAPDEFLFMSNCMRARGLDFVNKGRELCVYFGNFNWDSPYCWRRRELQRLN